jgi:hypothetical protein
MRLARRRSAGGSNPAWGWYRRGVWVIRGSGALANVGRWPCNKHAGGSLSMAAQRRVPSSPFKVPALVEGAARTGCVVNGRWFSGYWGASRSRRAMGGRQTIVHDVEAGCRVARAGVGGEAPVLAVGGRSSGPRVSLARCRIRRPSPRLVQLPESRPTSGGPAAVVSLRHGRHLRAEGCHLPEGSRLPNYPPEHHAPEGPGFCGQLLTQLPVCSLSGCSGSCTRWGYLDSGPTCRPVRVFPGGHARECFPSLLGARSTARTLPLGGHRCHDHKQHQCHRVFPWF